MAPTYQPRQFYCAKPIVPSCRRGFKSQAAFVQHRNAVHNTAHQTPTRPRLHPFQGESVEAPQAPPQGSYYTVHPILDGRIVQFIMLGE